MKAKYQAEDRFEMIRLAKSEDMALFIVELVNNGWREFKNTDYDYQKSWDKITQLLDKYNINVDDLVE